MSDTAKPLAPRDDEEQRDTPTLAQRWAEEDEAGGDLFVIVTPEEKEDVP